MVTQPTDTSDASSPLYIYLNAFMDELRRSGVRHAVVCPGSRSTPLAMALASLESQGGIRIWMHVDERSAGFFALGLAKRLSEPVVLVCTSGTAAANFYPAVVEAHLSRVPLLVLTADRPPELRDDGAPQSIDQNHLYGRFAKWFAEVALPEASNGALRYIRTLACRAYVTSLSVPAGPVHLNFPFREPLVPTSAELPPTEVRDVIAWNGRPSMAPYVQAIPATAGNAKPEEIARIASLLGNVMRGIVVTGPGYSVGLYEPLVHLAARLGFPLLADPLSGLRGSDSALCAYDAYLRSDAFVSTIEPEVILRIGAMPTSKPLLQFLQRYPHAAQIVVDEAGRWEEPTQLASDVLRVDGRQLVSALLTALPTETVERDCQWLKFWNTAEASTREAIGTTIRDFRTHFEGRIFRELANMLPDESALVVGNSMPVRDCDTFFWPALGRKIGVLGNRGANGIDGVVSTALGIAAAQPLSPTLLVIGDLSFFHDLNGLLAAKLHGVNLTVVLINNDGGGIFSFLPQAGYPEHFEQLFGTPTGLDFAPIVRMYGGEFVRVDGWEHFRAEVAHGISGGGLRVIEVRTERESNVTMHRALWRSVEAALSEMLANAGTHEAEATR